MFLLELGIQRDDEIPVSAQHALPRGDLVL
jgi:hypothetical protein